jgi:hypothetical protein
MPRSPKLLSDDAVDDTNPAIVAIYAAVQSQSYTEALRLSRRPEVASQPLAVALGALANSHLKCNHDALAAVEKLVRTATVSGRPLTDIKVLSILAQVYNRNDMPREKRLLYETAHRAAPESAEVLLELFFCHVFDGDYDAQKQVAMKLFKTGRHEFGSWVATVSGCAATPWQLGTPNALPPPLPHHRAPFSCATQVAGTACLLPITPASSLTGTRRPPVRLSVRPSVHHAACRLCTQLSLPVTRPRLVSLWPALSWTSPSPSPPLLLLLLLPPRRPNSSRGRPRAALAAG